MGTADQDQDISAENARLRARVGELEAEVAMLKATTAETLASAQETLYWWERWGLDFNKLFSTPQAELARKLVRGVRQIYRSGLKAKRSLLG